MVQETNLYGEYDRLMAEAELRDSVVLPVALFTIVALNDMSLGQVTEISLLVGVFGVLAVIAIHARGLAREGHSLLAHAIADGVVSTASLDRDRAEQTSG